VPKVRSPSFRIAGELRRRIESGELRVGEQVPSTRAITREWGVAIATATRVLATLREEGLVRAVSGVGTVVVRSEGRAGTVQRMARRHRRLEVEEDGARERIVRSAIEIADAEGLAALSMRRIAGDLGLATMSLYRYVPSKEDLVLAMMDAAFAEATLPEPRPSGWRAHLEATARLQWATYQRHPWVAGVLSMTRPQMLPHGVVHTEWALSAVDGLGLDATTMLHIAVTVFSFVRGTAAGMETDLEAEQDTGMSGDEWVEAQAPAMTEILATGPFPVMSRITREPIDLDLESLFEFGLARLLDGIAVLIERHQR
jgi:AcrR family transcriptional regulator